MHEFERQNSIKKNNAEILDLNQQIQELLSDKEKLMNFCLELYQENNRLRNKNWELYKATQKDLKILERNFICYLTFLHIIMDERDKRK